MTKINAIAHHSGIERMGFVKQSPPVHLLCRFYALKVYSLIGVTFDSQDETSIGRLNEHCIIGMGNDVNKLSVKITGRTYCDDPTEWIAKTRVCPPFLMTLTSSNIDYLNPCEWVKNCDDEITTYDCFSNAISDVEKCIVEYEIPYIPLVSAYFSREANLVKINHLESSYYGETPDGKLIRDSRVSAAVSFGLLEKVSLKASFTDCLEKTANHKLLGESCSRLLYDAMQEQDEIRSFIFTWMAVEIFIKKYYKDNCAVKEFPYDGLGDFECYIRKLYSNPNQGREIKTLAQKFAYLIIRHWGFLDISDYNFFKEAKETRDKFSHGEKVDFAMMPQVTQNILVLIGKIIANT